MVRRRAARTRGWLCHPVSGHGFGREGLVSTGGESPTGAIESQNNKSGANHVGMVRYGTVSTKRGTKKVTKRGVARIRSGIGDNSGRREAGRLGGSSGRLSGIDAVD
jgi:hypothetical protein